MNPELAALQQVIQDMHALVATVRDPGHTRVVAQCLTALTGIQKEMMSAQPQSPQGALMAAMGAGQQ